MLRSVYQSKLDICLDVSSFDMKLRRDVGTSRRLHDPSAIVPMRWLWCLLGVTHRAEEFFDELSPSQCVVNVLGGSMPAVEAWQTTCCGGITVDTVDGMGQNTVLSKADVQKTRRDLGRLASVRWCKPGGRKGRVCLISALRAATCSQGPRSALKQAIQETWSRRVPLSRRSDYVEVVFVGIVSGVCSLIRHARPSIRSIHSAWTVSLQEFGLQYVR